MSRTKELQKLEKKSNKKLLALLLLLFLNSKSQEQYILNVKKYTKSIVNDINDIREESSKLADKYSEIPVDKKPSSDKKRNIIITSAALYLLSKIAKHIYVSDKQTYEEKIKEALDNSKSTVERLVVTEIFQAHNQKFIQNNKNKRFRWDSTLDKRTCPTCSSRDGKEYDEADLPDLPVHQNCRCLVTLI